MTDMESPTPDALVPRKDMHSFIMKQYNVKAPKKFHWEVIKIPGGVFNSKSAIPRVVKFLDMNYIESRGVRWKMNTKLLDFMLSYSSSRIILLIHTSRNEICAAVFYSNKKYVYNNVHYTIPYVDFLSIKRDLRGKNLTKLIIRKIINELIHSEPKHIQFAIYRTAARPNSEKIAVSQQYYHKILHINKKSSNLSSNTLLKNAKRDIKISIFDYFIDFRQATQADAYEVGRIITESRAGAIISDIFNADDLNFILNGDISPFFCFTAQDSFVSFYEIEKLYFGRKKRVAHIFIIAACGELSMFDVLQYAIFRAKVLGFDSIDCPETHGLDAELLIKSGFSIGSGKSNVVIYNTDIDEISSRDAALSVY